MVAWQNSELKTHIHTNQHIKHLVVPALSRDILLSEVANLSIPLVVGWTWWMATFKFGH
jgi:hypothetical protein